MHQLYRLIHAINNYLAFCSFRQIFPSRIHIRVCGMGFAEMANGLAQFGGARRRFQLLGHVHNVQIIDDYAHSLPPHHQWYQEFRQQIPIQKALLPQLFGLIPEGEPMLWYHKNIVILS